MRRVEFRGWIVEVDRDATIAAYERMPLPSCEDVECRNFIAARDLGLVFSSEALALFGDLGIDSSKESERYLASPYEASGVGLGVYSGWFHAIGRLVQDSGLGTEIVDGFHLYPLADGELVPVAFGDAPVFRIEFQAPVPWVVQRAE